MSAKRPSSERWYPSREQLKDPSSLERTLRQVLSQHYALQDQFSALQARSKIAPTNATNTSAKPGPPPGSGPTDTQLLGLYVAPIDTRTLADGATLKYSKTNGNFHFS